MTKIYKKPRLGRSLLNLLITGLCLMAFNNVKAQVSTYAFTNTSGSWNSNVITAAGGATLLTSSTASTDDDITYSTITLPFTFNLAGTPYGFVSATSNGYIGLLTTATSVSQYSYPTMTNLAPTIELAGADMQFAGISPSTTSLGSNIYYQTLGTSPNRVFVIQYNNFSWYTFSTSNIFSGQIRLYETSGNVQIIYGGANTVLTGSTAQVGINSTTSIYSCITGTSFAGATASGTSTANMTFGSALAADSGRTFSWSNIPMTINSVTTFQTIGNASSGLNNNPILAAVANTTGNLNPKVVYAIDFNTAGSNNITTNVTAAKVLYTGNNATFSPGAVIRQFGTTISSPSGTLSFTSAGDTLRSGANYYWLVYDIPTTANLGDTLDGTCTSFTDSIARTPTVVSPAGYRIISGPLTGVYTIGGTGARNYASIAAAVNDLVNVGVAGPVTFNIAAGTYTGQVIIPNNVITGASAINNITFDGGNGNASTRIITSSTNSGATLLLNGCKYYTFKNLTITNSVSGQGVGVAIVGTATNDNGSSNAIRRCTILLPNVSTNQAFGINVTSSVGGMGNTATRVDSLVLDSNTITGGGTGGIYYGINVYGSQNALYNSGLEITNNTVTLGYYMGFQLNYIFNPMKINYNTINMSIATGYYAMYNYFNQSNNTTVFNEIIGNVINNYGYYGMYLYFNGSGGTTTAPLRIYNNVVNNGTNPLGAYYGIYVYNTGATQFYHNTTIMSSPSSSNTYAGFYYSGGTNCIAKNNLFSVLSNGGSAIPVYFQTNPSGNNVNYNLYFNGATTTLLFRGTNYISTNFKTATAGGDSSFFTATLPFVSNTNFRLQNGCFGKGVNLTSLVPADVTRFTRNVPPDLGAYEFQGGGSNDLSMDRLITPAAPITLGSQDLVFRVKNIGTNSISSFDANYTLNGGFPVNQTWSGTLASCDTVSVTFTGGQQITLGSSNAIKVYTANPNSSLDPNRGNDTISVTYLAPMSGAYTINPGAPASATNFQSFGAADTALQAGIAGPIYFTVAAGTYTGQVRIRGNIVGASAINNIVFDGVSSSTRTLTHSLNQGATLVLDKCKYVTFRNFTITNTISGNGVGVAVISTGTGYEGTGCGLVNNIINLPNVGTNTSYGINVTSTASGFGQAVISTDSLIIDSNTINNGYFGINLYNCCTASALYVRGTKIRNNTLNNISYMGMYIYYVYNAMDILNNTINMSLTGTTGYGLYYFYNQNSSSIPTRINGNKISNALNYGMYVYYPISGSATLQMYNNAILNTRGATGYSCYLYMGTGTTEVYNNSFVNTGNTTNAQYAAFYYAGTTANVNVKNNIFAMTGSGTGLPAYFGSNPTGSNINYNTYYNAASTNLVYRGTTFTNLTFKTATAGGDSSFTRTSSPFTSLTNLALTNGCSGKGVTLSSVTTDILGNTRNTPPDMGAYEFNGSANNDIAIDALLSPSFPVIAGSNDVILRIRNVGANTVSSFDAAYTINGGTPASTTWSGTLAACDTVSVNIGTSFTVVNNVQYALKAYTSNPNSSLDPNRGNDTITSTIATPMSGTYTIGATASDYTTFNNAVAALQLRGVAGPITFNVRTGVYTESVNLPTVTGMSATNTVTFTSLANNRDSVRMEWNSNTGNAFVLQFAGNFYTVNAMTIRSTSTSVNNSGVNIAGNASFDTLSNCNVRMPVYLSSFVFCSYSINAATVTGTGMAFINNKIVGSYYGPYYFGNSTNRPSYTYFKNNTFDSSYYSPFYYLYYTKYTTFDGNNFISRGTSVSSTTNYMYWYYNDSAYKFINNKVDFAAGISVYWYNYYKAAIPANRGLVANNAINAQGLLYLYFGNSVTSNLDFYNNTFNMGTGYFYLANSGLTSINFRNNIFSGTGAYPFYLTAAPSASIISSNYNNFFSTGSTTPIYAGTTFTLNAYKTAYPLFERNSVSFRPAYTSATNLVPNPSDTAIWLMNGRGDFVTSIVPRDINGDLRPATVADGAPDLGAYNVTPAANTLAPRAVANPLAPTAGTSQVFTVGFDTVATITWDAFTTPPTSIDVRQYSGRAPLLIGTTPNYMNFYTDIQAPAGTYLYDIKLNYRDNWMGTMYTTFGFTEADLRLAKKDAATAWSTNTGSVVDSSMNTLTGSGYTNFSWFTGSDLFNQLPVKLTTFNGKLVNADAILNWNTASEINANSFVVERSIDGVNFEGLGKVKAAGNSSSLKSYKYADVNALALVNKFSVVYYRLKMVDNDGSFEYSKTIEVKTDADTKESVKVNPNPFTNELTVSIETLVDSKATLEVVDINGRVTLTQNVNVTKGTSAINVDGIEKLKQGVYFVRVSTDLGTQVFKLIKN
ncbi:MAG: T9SS type A sorting domain-containing protein [Bacteroidota bacterium]